jgi:D-alanyl-D-alanine carboxypeptidase
MISFSFNQKILVKLLLLILKFINVINFELRWLFFIVFTLTISLSFWSLKDTSLDEFMMMTRRKPVLSLTETVPEDLIKFQEIKTEKSEVLAEKIKEEVKPKEKVLGIKPLNLLAKSYIVYDYKNSQELVSFNKSLTLPPASLVKMLSVMYFSKDLGLSDRLKVPSECTLVNGQKVGFKVNEEITVKDLIYSSLIYSGADSICSLSRVNPVLGIDGFNQYAKSLGMGNSNFTNYIGLDFTNNYTTSEDMLTMTKEFLKKDLFSEIVRLKSFELENGKVIYNTNKMLFSEKNSAGVKTGTTDGANENLIYRYKDDSNKTDLIIVILNSENRYQDVRQVVQNIYFN